MASENPPWGLRWRANTFFIVATVAVGLFTDLFLYGLIVPILPFMLRDRVDLPQEKVQSYVSGLLAAYAGASVLLSIPAGIIADKVKTRQAPFLCGLVALLGATLMLAFGQTIAVLVVARVLQGISAAFVWTVGLAMVLDTVGPGDLGKTIGTVCGRSIQMWSWWRLTTRLDFLLHICRRTCSTSARWCALRQSRLRRSIRARVRYSGCGLHHASISDREEDCSSL